MGKKTIRNLWNDYIKSGKVPITYRNVEHVVRMNTKFEDLDESINDDTKEDSDDEDGFAISEFQFFLKKMAQKLLRAS